MAETPEGLTRRIANFVCQTGSAEIPEFVYEHAKVALDWTP